MSDPIQFRSVTPPAERAWLITFADLVTLLLTFFVLLFSMSSVETERWRRLTDTLSTALGAARESRDVVPAAQYNISRSAPKRAINLEYLAAVLEEKMAKDPILARSRVLRQEDRVTISLPSDLLFGPGRAVLAPQADQAIRELGGILRNVSNQVGVSGHSDPSAPGSAWTSNWELSLARAVSVGEALRRAGYTRDVVTYGYGDSRYDDLPELPPAERQALARRVDVVVLPFRSLP